MRPSGAATCFRGLHVIELFMTENLLGWDADYSDKYKTSMSTDLADVYKASTSTD